jgi:hypothetical protein
MMKENNNARNILFCTALILFAVITRIINVELGLWLNFALIGAVSLFSGSVIKNKPLAYIIPLAAYLLSDLFLQFVLGKQGFYGIGQYFVYAPMLLIVFLGSKMGKPKAVKVFGFSLAGSAIFWLVSNFGVWFANYTLPSKSPIHEDGLTLAFTYIRALPFYNGISRELFLGTFAGDLIFSGILFGAYSLLKNKVTAPKAIAN